jgi:hypothetical protein
MNVTLTIIAMLAGFLGGAAMSWWMGSPRQVRLSRQERQEWNQKSRYLAEIEALIAAGKLEEAQGRLAEGWDGKGWDGPYLPR